MIAGGCTEVPANAVVCSCVHYDNTHTAELRLMQSSVPMCVVHIAFMGGGHMKATERNPLQSTAPAKKSPYTFP